MQGRPVDPGNVRHLLVSPRHGRGRRLADSARPPAGSRHVRVSAALGLGRANAERADLPDQAPRALDQRAVLRWLRAVEAHLAPRDRALAGVLFYAGARISEAVRLDVDDVRLSARKGILRILGKGEKVREVPIHPQLRRNLTLWLEERSNWPGAETTPALFLNQRGGRLSVRGPATSWPRSR